MVEDHQSIKICCPEEVAYINGWITKEELRNLGQSMEKNEYGQYLLRVASSKIYSY
jgi:glucose-1-phosphate thymidylyltransferase